MNVCRVCGCSDFDACVTMVDGFLDTCFWAVPDLCSFCAIIDDLDKVLEVDHVAVGEYL